MKDKNTKGLCHCLPKALYINHYYLLEEEKCFMTQYWPHNKRHIQSLGEFQVIQFFNQACHLCKNNSHLKTKQLLNARSLWKKTWILILLVPKLCFISLLILVELGNYEKWLLRMFTFKKMCQILTMRKDYIQYPVHVLRNPNIEFGSSGKLLDPRASWSIRSKVRLPLNANNSLRQRLRRKPELYPNNMEGALCTVSRRSSQGKSPVIKKKKKTKNKKIKMFTI
jgi:hypothetical protein